MKYLSFSVGGRATWGVATETGVIDMGKRFAADFPSLKSLVAAGFPARVAAAASGHADHSLAEIVFLPPITDPAHIWCLALNYVEHHSEVQAAGRVQELPKSPALFARTIDSLTGHAQPLNHPGVSDQFDFEAELAVVIGKPGYRIRQEDAFEHVAGYTIMNEGSVRDWQFHTRQITPGKNFFRSGALGPWIVPRGEIADSDVYGLRIRTTLNGNVMQDDTTDSMVHRIPRFIEYVSTITPLQPGDILATGTPGGVGFSRNPPVYMKTGDLCEISIDRIGTLRNQVAQAD
jgi:2-keto-4-pentenoate hydratase/2-oxohepta-3-ene-1,7-dioic acid hydratase in catechol pathway